MNDYMVLTRPIDHLLKAARSQAVSQVCSSIYDSNLLAEKTSNYFVFK